MKWKVEKKRKKELEIKKRLREEKKPHTKEVEKEAKKHRDE